MRLTVIHDGHGNIATLIASPLDSPSVEVALRPGQRMTEVDAPDIPLDLEAEVVQGRLRELIENYRVEPTSAKGGLSRKS